MSEFQPAVDFLLSHESGVFLAQDNGRGASKWGITLQSAQEFDPYASVADIQNLTRDRASSWYLVHRWQRFRMQLIEDQALANKVLDLLVNMGAGGWITQKNPSNPSQSVRVLKAGAITILQKCVNAPIDGILGPGTAQLVNAQDPEQLLEMYKAACVEHYQQLAQENPDLAKDRKGWIARAQD